MLPYTPPLPVACMLGNASLLQQQETAGCGHFWGVNATRRSGKFSALAAGKPGGPSRGDRVRVSKEVLSLLKQVSGPCS
jgi:hypothetical protein